MKYIKLYPILFEENDSNSMVDPKDLAMAVGDVLKPEFDKIGNRLEKTQKEVSTNSLSTSGAKPAAGSQTTKNDQKLDQIYKNVQNLQSSENIENLQTGIDSIQQNVQKLVDKKNI